ncbi:MAG: threonine ammonia-lyase IlvA [Chloroflexi bacterium]|nr:MAG: threonine ammonia-lyase IlvA [Chloroflexota bacterium]
MYGRGVLHPDHVPTPAEIREAAARLRPVAIATALEPAPRLSREHGGEVLLKREDLQITRSYKIRGAYNLIEQLPDVIRGRGVVCASAGNHAQGVAYSCARLGVPAFVFLPRSTPRQKLARIREIGGEHTRIELAGDSYDEAAQTAIAFADTRGLPVVPPFDHPDIIAGQGTVGLELVEAPTGPPDVLVVPVGGGGLIAGIAAYVRHEHPGALIIGAEPAGAPSMTRALEAGHPVWLSSLDPFVDGAAVRQVGELPLRITADMVDAVVEVAEGAVCTAMLRLYQHEGIVAEPAGALSVAALDQLADRIRGRRVACVLSGGNNDVSRYAEVIERSLVHEGLKHYFLVEFPQRPGALRSFIDGALGPGDDITFFEYTKKTNRESGPALVGIELARREDLEPLLERMSRTGISYRALDSTSPLFSFLV